MAEFQSLKAEVKRWDLTTDERFLSSLDTFLNQMLSQCEIIQKNTAMTEYETNAVSVYLGDTFNALSNLSNKQYIENSLAPIEEPQSTPKETKRPNEVPIEQRQENYRKAVQNAINVFNITNNDDDELLSKSHTMSMAMFKSTDHLPFLIGSKAFASDEYLGIIDKTEDPSKYLHKFNQDALDEPVSDNMQVSPSSGMSQGSSNAHTGGSANTVAAPASGKIELRDTSLQPPGPFVVLLEQYESRHGAGRPPAGGAGGFNPMANMMNEITGRGNAAPSGRPDFLNDLIGRRNPNPVEEEGGRPKLMTEIGGRGRLQDEAGSRQNLMDDITRNRLSTDMGGANRLADIRNNPMYQPITQQNKGGRLFDEEEDVEVGNADIFQSRSNNKKKFENLLSNPGAAPTLGSNSMFNPLAGNPFDPFGLSNPFMPFNPKSELAQNAAQKTETKPAGRNPMMGLPTEDTFGGFRKEEEPENNTKASKLNKLFDDSEDDDDARLKKQQMLSQKYRPDSKPIVQEEKIAPVITAKPKEKEATANARVSKLFDDEEDDGFMAMRKSTAPIKKEAPVIKPAAAKKTLFDEEEEDLGFGKKAKDNKKVAFNDDDEEDDLGKSSRRSKTMAGKNAKPSLFDDEDEDDLPIGAKKGKKEEPLKKKKTLFDDEDEGNEPQIKAQPPAKTNIVPAKEKKTMFDYEEEEVTSKKVEIVKETPKIVQQAKPIVEEKPQTPVYEEPKQVVQEPQERESRPSTQPAIFNDIEESKPVENRPSTGGHNLTQLIKASHLNKKKRRGGSSEEEDSEEDSPPVRPSIQNRPVVTQEVEKKEEEPEPVRQEEVKEETPVEEPVREEPVKEEPVKEEPKAVVTENKEGHHQTETESNRASVANRPSNISSKISALQNQLNLSADMFRPGEGLPPHMRKPKASIQPVESSEHSESIQNLAPGGISHTAAMSKPKQQARAKKTILFEDDDEEQEDPLAKKLAFTAKPQATQPTQIEKPTYQEPEVTRPSVTYKEQPVYQEQQQMPPSVITTYEEPVSQRPSTAQKKKVAFNDEVEQAPVSNPLGNPSSGGSDNPLALLKGLKQLDKGSPLKKEKPSKKAELFDDDEEEEKPKPTQAPSLGSGAGNPMALLGGLKELDASKGRKSAKPKKGKGIFDDDEEDEGFGMSRKSEQKPPATKAGGNKLTMFDDSDEDKKAKGRKTQTQTKIRPSLFDDDE